MARVQVYVSDEVSEKIRVIAEKRRAEGARDKDVSFSSIASMLVELGLRVYEAQMERKESSFNQALYNKTILENVMKTQFIVSKLLAMESLSSGIWLRVYVKMCNRLLKNSSPRRKSLKIIS